MGWFWADTSTITATSTRVAPHTSRSSDASPPPGCPMHKPSSPTLTPSPTAVPPGACPYNPPDKSPSGTTFNTPSSKPVAAASSSSTLSTLQKLNPLNYMPSNLSQKREFDHQTHDLPTEREPSTIPRGDGSGNWEYPSPQQMYNAMLRKGYTDTPAEHVESMVAVHNFLNEGAWAEILEWERRFGRGIMAGWKASAKGEMSTVHSAASEAEWDEKAVDGMPEPRLVRFMGRPNERTPKATIMQYLGYAWPSQFASEPPFDRHDWYISRCDKEGRCKEMRYVIDYYEGPDEASGEPVFFLDVRPAVDSPSQAGERFIRWYRDIWWRASGGIAREAKNALADNSAPRKAAPQ